MSVYIKDPNKPALACVIWMHGLGADAQDMAGLAEQLPLKVPVRHVFMDAPVRPVYGPAWRSGISLLTVLYPISFVLLRSWVWRRRRKFHSMRSNCRQWRVRFMSTTSASITRS